MAVTEHIQSYPSITTGRKVTKQQLEVSLAASLNGSLKPNLLFRTGSAVRSDQILSTCILKTFKDRGHNFPGYLLHHLTILMEKKVLLMAILNLLFQVMAVLPHPPTMHHCQDPVCLLNNLPPPT